MPVVLVAVVAVGAAACSADGGRSGPGGRASSPTTSPTSSLPVPGSVHVPVGFCPGWDAYGATLLALAAAPDAAEAARREVVAAAALVDAVETIGDQWPSALVGERSLVLADVVGPYLRRARKALAALADAGATTDDVGQLALAWREALLRRSADDPGSLEWIGSVAVPASLRATVASAADLLVARLPSFADDPTLPGRRALVGSIDTPRTDDYLAANCPMVGDVMAAMEF